MTDPTPESAISEERLAEDLRSLATSLKRPGGKESRITKACTRAAAALDDLRARLAAAEGREASLEKRRDYYRERMEAAEALATTATARVAELEGALKAIDALEVMEVNPSNYNHDDVCELSNNAVQAALIAARALTGGSNG